MGEEEKIKVIILAGGLGTRLKEETEHRPKPLVKIGGKPIIWHIMKLYSHYGFNDFIIAGGYKVELIKEYFINYHYLNNDIHVDLESKKITALSDNGDHFSVSVIDTGLNTLTGGRIKRLKKLTGDNKFMVTYGDGVSNVDIRELLRFHNSHGKIATVTGVHPPSRFGELNLNDNRVKDFKEKPQTTNSYINGGFFVFEPEIFDFIEGDATSLEREPLEKLASEGQLAVFKHKGFWKCMDTQRDMEELNDLWNKTPKWKVWE